jgi:hypothetical protein
MIVMTRMVHDTILMVLVRSVPPSDVLLVEMYASGSFIVEKSKETWNAHETGPRGNDKEIVKLSDCCAP